MIIRHTPEQIQEYFERAEINQSSLKVLLDGGIQAFIAQKEELQKQDDLYYEEKVHFIVGGAVDTYLTQGAEVYESKYHISKLVKKPGDKGMSVINLAFDMAKEKFPLGPDTDINLYKQEIYDAANQEAFYMNRKKDVVEEDQRLSYLLKDNGYGYWMDLCLAEGKQILSDTQKMTIDNVIMSITTHKFTKYLFEDSDDVSIVFQFPMYWNLNGVNCKGLVDMIIIDYIQKKIFPIDIKTIGDYVTRFNKAVRRRRYDLQAAFYTNGIINCKTQLSTLTGKYLADYEVTNFAFIVESTIRPGTPLVFPLTDEALKQGEVGDGEDLQGYTQGIDLYKMWAEVDFSLEKKLEESNGVVFIDENFNYNSIL